MKAGPGQGSGSGPQSAHCRGDLTLVTMEHLPPACSRALSLSSQHSSDRCSRAQRAWFPHQLPNEYTNATQQFAIDPPQGVLVELPPAPPFQQLLPPQVFHHLPRAAEPGYLSFRIITIIIGRSVHLNAAFVTLIMLFSSLLCQGCCYGWLLTNTQRDCVSRRGRDCAVGARLPGGGITS